MTTQHHKPCGTCPFTRKALPKELGGSPPETYVAQHFMPFRVPCHEFVDYDREDWKKGAIEGDVPQCVGFAECRNGGAVDGLMPDGLLKETYDAKHQTFHDIWDFWAYHQECTRRQALIQVHPYTIYHMFHAELHREGFEHLSGDPVSLQRLMGHGMMLAQTAWTDAMNGEFDQVSVAEACGGRNEPDSADG